jgi:hypothetical protein
VNLSRDSTIAVLATSALALSVPGGATAAKRHHHHKKHHKKHHRKTQPKSCPQGSALVNGTCMPFQVY